MKYVKTYIDRHGQKRWYLRRGAARQIALPNPDDEDFAAAYQAALAETPATAERAAKTAQVPQWARGHAGGVYFVQALDRVKIGFSNSLMRRITDIQIGSPVVVTLLLVIPGDRAREHELHQQFRHLHQHGEWFVMGPELVEFIEAERTNTGQV